MFFIYCYEIIIFKCNITKFVLFYRFQFQVKDYNHKWNESHNYKQLKNFNKMRQFPSALKISKSDSIGWFCITLQSYRLPCDLVMCLLYLAQSIRCRNRSSVSAKQFFRLFQVFVEYKNLCSHPNGTVLTPPCLGWTC